METKAEPRAYRAPAESSGVIIPYGSQLLDLMADPERRKELMADSLNWPSWDLTPRQFCGVELLLNSAFSQLPGFIGRAGYDSVCVSMRLADGLLWPIPVMLEVTEDAARRVGPAAVFGASSKEHPAVGYLLARTNPWSFWACWLTQKCTNSIRAVASCFFPRKKTSALSRWKLNPSDVRSSRLGEVARGRAWLVSTPGNLHRRESPLVFTSLSSRRMRRAKPCGLFEADEPSFSLARIPS
jgi:hypothetical protein